MRRVAWFSPLPPTASGIAAYSAELLPLLRAHGLVIDTFTDANAHDFVWKHRRNQYDLTVFHMGNAQCHDYMWAYVFRYPGLIVLHDAQLHQARALFLTKRWKPRRADYLAEFRANHPEAPADAGELVAAGLGGSLYHLWPLVRLVIEASRMTLVHNARLRDGLREKYPAARIDAIEMGVGDPEQCEVRSAECEVRVPSAECDVRVLSAECDGRVPSAECDVRVLSAECDVRVPSAECDVRVPSAECEARVPSAECDVPARRAESAVPPRGAEGDVRSVIGVPRDAIVLAAFGGITPEKRIGVLLRALSAVAERQPRLHFVLVGRAAEHYDVLDDAARWGVADRVHVTGFVSDGVLPAYLHAADICACLRWPTNRETSASWLRCIAAGRTTMITDLSHQADIPTIDPRGWRGLDTAAGAREPVAVSIDLLDEEHSLQLAIERLATDAPLRERLGRAGRAWYEAHHRLEPMADAYARVIAAAMASPAPAITLPSHLTDDTSRAARQLADSVGVGERLAGVLRP